MTWQGCSTALTVFVQKVKFEPEAFFEVWLSAWAGAAKASATHANAHAPRDRRCFIR
jgi:hypothetical protein